MFSAAIAFALLTSVEPAKIERGWNYDAVTQGETTTATFRTKWINYLESDGKFEPIDTSFSEINGAFRMENAPFTVRAPLFADGVARFYNNNRYDNIRHEEIEADPFVISIQSEEALHIRGEIIHRDLVTEHGLIKDVSYVLYKDAYESGADLIYYVHHGRAPRIQKLVKFNSKGEVFNPRFRISFDTDPVIREKREDGSERTWGKESEYLVEDFSELSFVVSPSRAASFKNLKVWDSSEVQKIESIELLLSPQDGEGWYAIEKRIPAGFLDDAEFPIYTDTTTTFYPDPDTESTSVDGHVQYATAAGSESPCLGAIWNSAHDSSSGTSASDSATTASVVAYATQNQVSQTQWVCEVEITKGFLLFDTSSIPDSATIDSATVSVYVTAKTNNDNDGTDYINIYTTTPASNTALVVGDYNDIGTTAQATQIDIGSITTSAFNDWTLNATGIGNISLAGVTKFGMREGHDATDVPAVARNSITWNTAESGNDPELEVTYTAVSGPAFNWFTTF